MQTIALFTDAATSPQASVAVGAFLYLEQEQLLQYDNNNLEHLAAELSKKIIYTEYASKKSTWSEIKTVIAAIQLIHITFGVNCNIKVYTDCQSLCDLLTRRKEKLQNNNFITRNGKTLEHADLYKELFAITQKSSIQFLKVKGHNKISAELSLSEKIFLLVDKLSRKKLRLILMNR